MDLLTNGGPTAASYLDQNRDVARWITAELEHGNDFARSLWSYLQKNGQLTDRQLGAVRRSIAKSSKPAKAPGAIDLRAIPSGMYAIPDGETRLKVRIDIVAGGRWDGWVFVSDGAAYGGRKKYGAQRPGENYAGDIEEQLLRILADPLAASMAYGQLVGRCGVCGLALENEESVARGIGPICFEKF